MATKKGHTMATKTETVDTKNTKTETVDTKTENQNNTDVSAELSDIKALLEKLAKKNEELEKENSELKKSVNNDAPMLNETAIAAMEEKVKVHLFKDNGKYKDDKVVILNGTAYQIKRGVDVYVPRAVADILMRSEMQDQKTAEMIEQLEKEYQDKLANE